MHQPTPTITLEDIHRIVSRDFPGVPQHEVMEVLDGYGRKSWQTEHLRVRMAALKLANGDIEKLKKEIENAACDYRDVLLHAEYPLCAKKMLQDLNDDENEEIYKKDWAQYQTWLNR
jgi:hypothetical protein